MKKIHIWDLDGTIIDSSHRIQYDEGGKLDIRYWIENSTPQKIRQDKLMPHSEHYLASLEDENVITVIATARAMTIFDIAYINDFLGKPDYFVYRLEGDSRPDYEVKNEGLEKIIDKNNDVERVVFWDDNLTNIKKVNNMIYDKGHEVITCHVNCNEFQ